MKQALVLVAALGCGCVDGAPIQIAFPSEGSTLLRGDSVRLELKLDDGGDYWLHWHRDQLTEEVRESWQDFVLPDVSEGKNEVTVLVPKTLNSGEHLLVVGSESGQGLDAAAISIVLE